MPSLANMKGKAKEAGLMKLDKLIANRQRIPNCEIPIPIKELCERYLHVIDKMPFEGDFCEDLRAKMADPKALVDDPTIGRILQFLPREQKFEQNFRTPPFLGYNVGVLSGTDETLNTSVAAALYSKDMENIIMRSQYLMQKRTLPLCVQQALVIADVLTVHGNDPVAALQSRLCAGADAAAVCVHGREARHHHAVGLQLDGDHAAHSRQGISGRERQRPGAGQQRPQQCQRRRSFSFLHIFPSFASLFTLRQYEPPGRE